MIRILHTNDMHGTLTQARVEKLRELRNGCDFYFDSGDCVKAGNLAIPLKPEAVWPLFAELECTASVPGNRESHITEGAFKAKLAGVSHPVLCGNLKKKDGSHPLPGTLVLEHEGLRIGVLAVMVPMVTERMATKAASAFLWEQPIPVAIDLACRLRPDVDLLIALTHIGYRDDLSLAERCPGIDIILGGHSHTVLHEPVRIGNTFVCQGGSHNRFAGVYAWSKPEGLTGALHEL